MAESQLYNVLSGLLSASTKINDNFVKYDADLSGIIQYIDEIEEQATSYESEDPEETPDDNTITFIQRPKISTLSGSTAYELEIGKIYNCTIVADTSFGLPEVTDDSRFYEILMTVKYSGGTWHCTFKDYHNNTLTPLDNNEWSSGDVVQYMIRYEAFLGNWVVMQVKVGTAS